MMILSKIILYDDDDGSGGGVGGVDAKKFCRTKLKRVGHDILIFNIYNY